MDWVCSGCGRHFNWSVSECPYCRHQTTITTGGTQLGWNETRVGRNGENNMRLRGLGRCVFGD